MKILAIRGKNLASLSAEFVVDFQSEPLASAGFYAITGPTGSGKSTLLDALCLALYERTPRLQRATSKGETIPDVGDNAVTPSDPRTLLRRGAAEGFAEVDFVGSDGVAYRSRWAVRRARAKAGGKLQPSEISLIRLADSQALGDHTKTETLRLIEARIGLSFEQFTRAVLLAQNDFAAFLKASDDERAELLQTLTGTGTFSAISMQAFARMKTEKDLLERLQAQLKEQQPLSPELRAGKLAEQQTQAESARALAQQKALIEGHLRWHQQWEQLKAAEAEAGAKLAAAVDDNAAAAPRHEQLAQLERVQAARAPWLELDRLSRAEATTRQGELEARAALTQAELAAQRCQAEHEAAQQQLASADSVSAQAQPAIDQAKALDTRIQTLTPQFENALQAQMDASERLDAEQMRQADAVAAKASAQSELDSARDWLAEHASLQPLAEGWQRWEALLAQAQAARTRQGKTLAELERLRQEARANSGARSDAQTELEQLGASAQTTSAQLDALSQRCAAVDGEELARSRQALEDRREQLQAAAQLWQARMEAQGRQEKLAQQQQQEAAALTRCELALQAGAQSQPPLEAALHAAEQALQLARLAASKNAETLRASLRPGEACPVCGALEHPYASHSPVADAMLQSLQAHLKEQQKALRELLDGLVRAAEGKTTAEQALAQITRELAQLERERAALAASWSALPLHGDVEALPEPERSGWLTATQEALRAELAHISEREAGQRELLKQKDAAQRAFNTAQSALARASDALNRLAAEAAAIGQAADTAHQQQAELAQQLDATLAQLDGAFADAVWRGPWAESPEAFVAHCRQQAQAWLQRQHSMSTLMHGMAALAERIAASDSACQQAARQVEAQTAMRAGLEAQLQADRRARAQLLAGRPVAEVESGLQAASAAARQAVAAAQQALQQAQAELARGQEGLRQATLQVEQQGLALAAARRALDDWLADFNAQGQGAALRPDALKSLLDISPAWVAAEREALQALQRELHAAQAVLATRRDSLAAHEAGKATTDTLETLQAQLDAASRELGALAENLSILRLDLARDDERLQASVALRSRIEEQGARSRIWSQLGELIGSADGKKFRNFAQQLTLDILLGHGNRHLQSLSSRYRLERIADSLGLLVVDQDMGDEIRSVHSLSGGESFLVSLALALGLASLSSHRVRVESLFIDEGFGSLDADSLRVAMDALDSLQAQGRKVGVISHVQEMTERIGTQVQVRRLAGGQSRVFVG